MAGSTIFADVDYDKPGRQVGWLRLPHSPHSDAWGTVAIPVAVIAHGTGPTLLLTGGNHGDEYEGPIAINRLIRDLDPARIEGRIIALPALNAPAVLAASRVSPLDGRNLNRCFPGDPLGSVTEQIAFYYTDVLLPMADAAADLHSGGSSLDMVPSAIVEPTDDADLLRRITEAVLAFDAPLSIVHHVPGDPRTSNATVVRAGKVMVGTELGGGGGVSVEGVAVAERGLRNLLHHMGMADAGLRLEPFGRRTRLLRARGHAAHVYSPEAGVFEPFHELGAEVEAGVVAGVVHFLDDPAREPVPARFGTGGTVFSRRAPGRVERGSCLAVVGGPA